jgi:hypothetical protein
LNDVGKRALLGMWLMLAQEQCEFCSERFERPPERIAGAVLTRTNRRGGRIIGQYQLVQKDGRVFHKCEGYDRRNDGAAGA